MRTGISINVSSSGRRRLAALVRDRNAAQKHVWRAEIVLLSVDGVVGARMPSTSLLIDVPTIMRELALA